MSSVFLCHSSQDKEFVRKLAEYLKSHGVRVWLDEAELNIGDSLQQKLGQAIDEADFLGVVLSTNSIDSEWVQRELQVAMERELSERKTIVLPLLLEPVTMPPFLRGRLYADFTTPEKYEEAFLGVLKALGSSESAITKKIRIKERSEEHTMRENERAPSVVDLQNAVPRRKEVMIKLGLENLDEKSERWLRFGLAKFLEISEQDVQIVVVEKGSVKVTIELPIESAVRLLRAYKRNDPDLREYLAPLGLIDICEEVEEHKRKPKSKEFNRVRGIVKWYSRAKGYGFITRDDGGDDVFVHYSAIVGQGVPNLDQDDRVEFVVEKGNKGPAAGEVRKLPKG